MSNRLLQAEFESVLKPFLGRYSSFHFFWKGRVALYAFLRAMGIGPGDEVILPAYTCVVVPSAILYTGATPVYVDINPDTYCCDPEAIERSITPRTKAILVQNTYGLSWKVDEIAQMGSDRNIVTIEDCTHGFGGMYDGVPNGSRCDASFFSSQWNKPFSTGLGGYLQVNRAEFTEKMAAIEVSNPGRIQELELAVQLALKKRLLTDKTYWKLRSIYRLLSRFNILRGSSQGSELSRLEMPVDFLQGMTDIQFKSGILAMGEFPRVQ
ncbi:DegT/DnrJ/EryC1/StrS aminotransferase family protein, partial [bacterium]|nr:DegT/DnrJ/EryC1/StrS aminotransferase family protein [bacterium]